MKIELTKISLEFDGEFVLDDLNIVFEKNKLNCLLGKSGSGKTSILKIIAGISPPFKGLVYLNNLDATDLSPKARNIGWVPQQQLLFPGLNVKENIAYGLNARRYSKSAQDNRISQVAELAGLTHLLDRTPERLSGGERQRVAIARALAPSPKILLLDEPFSSLDAPERDRLALMFREIQLETGVTTVHVTHSPREAELISDQIFVLASGKILQKGSMKELYSYPISIEVARLLSIPNVIKGGFLDGVDDDVIIPTDSIELHTGQTKAKVLSITKLTVHLLLSNNIRLEANSPENTDLLPGEIISIKLNPSQFIRFGRTS
ncbi:MAG: ABC transporter ATP-binding protein [Candidatus Kariarchaeaceae archaeon]